MSTTHIPVLETERLILRPHHRGDLDAVAALWSDPEVTRYIGGKPSTRAESWTRLMRYAGHWALQGYGYWAVVERESGRYLGDVGLSDFLRELELPLSNVPTPLDTPSIEGVPEAGWVLSPVFQGRGLATEAVRAALAWADRSLAARRTFCIISPENQPSLRVAEKLGYVETCRTTYGGSPIVLMHRTKE